MVILLVTLLFMVIGYVFGSISPAVLLTEIFKKEDVRTKGSGNAGATNVVRNYGKKLGGIVFLLDIIKVIIPVSIAYTVKMQSPIDAFNTIEIPLVAFSVIIGHIWPIFFNFKGGKGAACFVGFIFCLDWPMVIIGAIIFFIILKTTKIVAIGSLVTPIILLFLHLGFSYISGYSQVTNTFMNSEDFTIEMIVFAVTCGLMFFTHRSNIKRILNKKENAFK